MSKISQIVRMAAFVALIVAMAFLCGVKLLEIQVVDGESYLAESQRSFDAKQEIEAARGQIVDSAGKVLTTNKIAYKIILQRAFLAQGTENTVIQRILSVLIEKNEKWNETLPISQTQPYVFLDGREKDIETLKAKLELGVYATVDNCMYELYKKFAIPEDYPEEMRRLVAGVRYEMLLRDFSQDNRYTFADDISEDTVATLKELSFLIQGMDIIEEATRVYAEGTTAPHILGTVGAISPEKYTELRESGYSLNDTIGLSGIELAMEQSLRGENGTRTIVRNSNGEAVSDEITVAAQTGNSVMLTIDSEFQTMLQDILKYQIDFLNSPHYTQDTKGIGCQSGSVVVLDVKTGAVLGMASYPSYDLNDLKDNYSEILNAENSPLFNRAINGLYRPGSTFKTITATAGLVTGVIDENMKINCTGIYTYYHDYHPTCTQTSGPLDVRHALRWSCNIFFYETARRMGITTLADWAGRFGVGTDLGLEIGGESGQMSSLELFEEKGLEWNEGNVVQAGIGQLETQLTTLNLAVQAMTVANRGIRYKPYLVKQIMDYDCKKVISKTQPTVVEDMSEYSDAFQVVTEGMELVADAAMFTRGSSWINIFADLPEQVAIKTGTPQTSNTEYNSAVVGFYPADNPEIAFGVLLEKGEYSRHVAANLIKAYITGKFTPVYDEDGFVVESLY